MNKEQSSRWKKLQGGKKGHAMKSFYTVILWIILIISVLNGVSASSTAQSAIHQIYGSLSFLIASIVFCTLAIRAKMSEESEYIVTAIRKLKETIIKEDEALKVTKEDM